MNSFFEVTTTDPGSRARTGVLRFQSGGRSFEVETPIFMPVGTAGTVKALWQEDLEEIGYDLILANTYHTYLRPGTEILQSFGGLKPFMSWEKHALLTDSGGYQVFSLSDRVKFLENGVQFQSHIDGSRHMFTPGSVVDTQLVLGSDIMMVLDDCPPGGADEKRLRESLNRTHRWAKEAWEHYNKKVETGLVDPEKNHLFGIIQGGTNPGLRKESAEFIQSLPFHGIAVGGLSVGESREELYESLRNLGPLLDPNRPRYLMGVGTIPDFLQAIENGIDMFDCVLPTRNARNGQALTSRGKVRIKNASYAQDSSPIDPECNCRTCRRYSAGYIRHLFQSGEMLGPQLLTFHNLYFFYNFMSSLRESIRRGEFSAFNAHWKNIQF